MPGQLPKTGLLHRFCTLQAAVLLSLFAGAPATAIEHRDLLSYERDVQKQVALLLEPGQLLASNIRLGRIDVLELEPEEALTRQAEADGALVAVTDQRILAYGPAIGWREMPLLADEQVEALRAEDYAVFIITDRRHLNFNA